MQQWTLLAIERLGGSGRIGEINVEVKQMLQLPDEITDQLQPGDSRTMLEYRVTWARSKLKTAGLLDNPADKVWALTEVGKKKVRDLFPSDIDKLASRVGVDTDAVEYLATQNISAAKLADMYDLWIKHSQRQPFGLRTYSSQNLEVEAKAIEFIRGQEPNWHTTKANNPGFDLYQTANNRKNGKKTLWCEVKSFSSKFSSAELTPTEFRTALQKGESYWLYIVENVKSKSPKLLRIQNPVDKVFRYRIGSDWRTVATY